MKKIRKLLISLGVVCLVPLTDFIGYSVAYSKGDIIFADHLLFIFIGALILLGILVVGRILYLGITAWWSWFTE